MLAGAALHVNGATNLAGVCTFGQPAVGNLWFTRQFRRQLGDRYFRFVNSIDAIPLAPTLAHHVGKPFYFEASGRLRRGAPLFRQLGNAAVEGWRGKRGNPLPQLKAHTIGCYRSNLWNEWVRLRELLGESEVESRAGQ